MARPKTDNPLSDSERQRRSIAKKRAQAGLPDLPMRAPAATFQKVTLADGSEQTVLVQPSKEALLAWHKAWVAHLERAP